MLDATQQTKFARQCGDAAFGYARTSMAAYGALLDQSMSFWTAAAGAAAGKPEKPAQPAAAFPFMMWPMFPAAQPARPEPVASANPFLAMWDPAQWTGLGNAASAKSFNPWTMWFDMVASPRAVTANPMAVWMMSFGVPQSVARPAAEAHAAALDAADTATASINSTFASYRSNGGHAAAQVISPKQMALSMMYGPVGAAMLMSWPWGGSGHGV